MITKKFSYKTKVKIQRDPSEMLAALEEFISAVAAIHEALEEKYNKRVKYNLEQMIKIAADDFFGSYSPHIYQRQEGGVEKGAKPIVEYDEDWSIDLGPEFIEASYRASTDYIYENSFVNGYHGGATGGPNHPEPGTPWWKWHGLWYKPATRGPSIKQGILNQNPEEYIKQQEKAYADDAERLLKPYLNRLTSAIIRFLKGVS